MNWLWRVCLGLLLAVFTVGFVGGTASLRAADDYQVEVKPDEPTGRVEILVDGRPFTSYIHPKSLTKPVLFPIRTSGGKLVTRGFPITPRPGERVDHPHQVGLWFTYGDVNGVDFWNNSTRLSPEQRAKMGFIAHRKIVRAAGGKQRGELEITAAWLMPRGRTILREDTTFVFHAGPGLRGVDRITKLTALSQSVTFKDNKEGVIGLRVSRALEQPTQTPDVFIDSSGRPTEVPVLDNEGVSGLYRSSEGISGDAVWGTRGRWVALSGKVDGEQVTVTMFDHPGNPGYPTYWHARGYGLFAANPLGQKALSGGKEELNLKLKPKESITFKHRILILTGEVSTDHVEGHYRSFLEELN